MTKPTLLLLLFVSFVICGCDRPSLVRDYEMESVHKRIESIEARIEKNVVMSHEEEPTTMHLANIRSGLHVLSAIESNNTEIALRELRERRHAQRINEAKWAGFISGALISAACLLLAWTVAGNFRKRKSDD